MLHTLNVAQTGLKTSQTQVENVMNNIANQNTEGYKKRVVNTSEIDFNDARITGRGVLVNDVTRVTDVYMFQNIITEEARLNDYKELNSMLEDIESIFAETDDSGLSADLNRYFESIENLRTTPSNEVYKNDIINNANSLVTDLKTLYEDIEKKEKLLLDETVETVDKVNEILTEIGNISKKITDTSYGNPNDLLDKRDALEQELAQYVDVEIFREDSYQLKIAGVTAVRFDTNVHEIQLVENYTPQQDIYVAKAVDGTTLTTGINGDFVNSIPSFTGTSVANIAEVQTLDITGTLDDGSGDPATTAKTITFLGQAINVQMGYTAGQIADAIVGDANNPGAPANIIATWNAANPHKTIASITQPGGAGTTGLQITYNTTEGDVPPLDVAGTSSKGIIFDNHQEVIKGFVPRIGEAQTLEITGSVDDGSTSSVGTTKTIEFLGYSSIPVQMGDDQAAVTQAIIANEAAIRANWNAAHPDQEIASIVLGEKSNQLIINYANSEGDVPSLANSESKGINFTGSIEEVKGSTETLTYMLNGTYEVSVTVGDILYEADGVTPIDFDNSGAPIGAITEDNIIQALVYAINNDQDIGGTITAYNGKYELDEDGNKILTSDLNHTKYQDPTLASNPNNPGHQDRYLFVEATIGGEEGSFVGELLVNNNNVREISTINDTVSKEGIDDIHLEIYEKEITVSSGALSPILDNIKTDSGNNLFKAYKEKLDLFAEKLADLTGSYIENLDGSYIMGTNEVSVNYDADKEVKIDLFTGTNVKSLEFNAASINTMTQEKLDYLSSLQWDSDIDFDGTGENNQSFAEYFKTLRVTIADDRETIIFNEEAQEAVTESLTSTYNELTKVDKDEEMVNLIKFQAAYEANAKIITTVDEMLQVLLGIKK